MNIRLPRGRWHLIVTGLVSLLVVEGTLRLFPAALPAALQQAIDLRPGRGSVAHPYIGHLNRPTRGTDPYGFRNGWPWPDAPGIVTLGDSVTLGHEVEAAESWPAVLERAFPDEGVVNLALGSSGPQQYLRVFETFGLPLRARLVLIGLFVRNDFWDASVFEKWLNSGAGGNYMVWRDSGRPKNVRLSPGQPIGKLVEGGVWRGEVAARKTYLGNLLLHTAGRSTVWTPPRGEVYEAPDGTQIELQPESFFSSTRPGYRGDGVFTIVVNSVRRIHALAHRNRGRAVVVFLPSKEEVYLPLLRESFPHSTALLRTAFDELGIPSVDLLEDFRRRAAGGEVLFQPTASQLPNARGHAVIAELVISHLREHAHRYGLSRPGPIVVERGGRRGRP